MRQRLRGSGIILSLLCIFSFAHAAKLYADDEADQRKKFEQLRKQIEELKAELEETRSSRDELHNTLESNEKDISELEQKTKKLQRELQEGRKELQELRDERGELIQKKSRESELVAQYISSAHQLGKHSQIRLLLNQQQPAEVSRMLRYYEFFGRERREKISTFRDTINRLNDIEPQITAQTQRVQNRYDSLVAEKQKLSSSQAQRRQLLAKLNSDLQNQENEIQQLVKDRQRLQALLTRMNQAISEQELALNVSEITQVKGQLPWPTQGKLLNKYGSQRIGNAIKWQGLRIAADSGTEVVSVHHGQVVFADYLRGQGLLIIIDHGAGYMSLYAHNQVLYKETGEWVEAGERIAAVGNTGGQINAALYFELRLNGKPTNPHAWLRS
jgi:septal ring factor EnvC (AmiA/AmiB activator)